MKTNEDVVTLLCALLELPNKAGWEEWDRAQAHNKGLPQPKPTYTVIEYEGEDALIVRHNETGAVFRLIGIMIHPGTK